MQSPRIVLGLGTGRCGTQSLAAILNHQERARVTHERHGPGIAWQGDEDRVTAFMRQYLATSGFDLVGDVAFYYLPYVEHALSLAPDTKFVCLKRDRKSTVDSYLTWSYGRNSWMQHDGTRWRMNDWYRCYPKYPVGDKEEAIGRYWDEYYDRAAALEASCARSFRVFPTESLNTAAGQHEIFEFLGLRGRPPNHVGCAQEFGAPAAHGAGPARMHSLFGMVQAAVMPPSGIPEPNVRSSNRIATMARSKAERRNNVYNSLVGWALARRDSLGDGLKPILQLVKVIGSARAVSSRQHREDGSPAAGGYHGRYCTGRKPC